MYKIPILFIIFNRKETSIQSFKKIKEIKPSILYIASDGARQDKPGEDNIVEDVRNVILEQIDWPCIVKKRFRDKNVGCSKNVYEAINWLFENEEKGIILEDDCVVSDSFFDFMQYLLDKYENDLRVGMVAGHNQLRIYNTYSPYIFSKYKACWGWGTWKRAWNNMDYEMKWRTSDNYKNIILNMGYNGRDYKYWKYRLQLIDKNRVSAWDWQWYFSLAANNQLCIFPVKNLVSNIGFGNNATHTSVFGKVVESFCLNSFGDDPLVTPNFDFDYHFYRANNTLYNKINQLIPFFIKKNLKTILKIFRR